MKLFAIFLALAFASGCTTLKPVEMPPEQLHDLISRGEVAQVGDRIKVVTADGSHHELRVTAVTDDSIAGGDIDIAIADIIALKTREFSGGKTAALAGGTYLVYSVMAGLVALLALASG